MTRASARRRWPSATPVSLRDYGKVEDVDALSAELMGRIEAVMPVLGVPLVATALLRDGRDGA